MKSQACHRSFTATSGAAQRTFQCVRYLLPAAFVLITGLLSATEITDVFVQPSVREKKLTLEIEMAGATGGDAKVVASLLDEQGKEEKKFEGALKLGAAPGQTARLAFAWADPRLWDLGQPNLYRLKLSIDGAGLRNATYETTFGFREIWIEGRDFILNGTRVHFRPINNGYGGGGGHDAGAKFVDEKMAQGFNLIEIWPSNEEKKPGELGKLNEELSSICDRKGMGLTGWAPYIVADKDTPASYQAKLEKLIKRFRNHPSILLWGGSGNAFLSSRDQHPKLIGQRDYIIDLETEMRFKRGMDCIQALKAWDPTRPTFSHAGCFVGDVYTSNNYLCFLPLQEREEWLSAWAKDAPMPYLAVEFGTPLFTSYLRGRAGYGEVLGTEPFVTEWAACYFGSKAYADEKDDYRRAIASQFQKEMQYKSWRWGAPKEVHDAFFAHPGFVGTQALFIRNTWRAWRTWGISGGMVPWESANEHLDLVAPYNGPSLAWIAGPRETFTDKAHSFRAGAPVTKSAVLINDHRMPQPYDVKWEATVGETKAGGGATNGILKPGETLFVPLVFSVPAKIDGTKADGTLVLNATIGPDKHQDRFSYRVFNGPRASSPASGSRNTTGGRDARGPENGQDGRAPIHLYDPVGETSVLLKDLGCQVKQLPVGAELPSGGVVVIGRKVLSAMKPSPLNLDAFVRGGGRLLVMGQDRMWLRQGLGLRTAEYLARRVYRVIPGHSVVAGLDDFDLSDWAGESGLMPVASRFEGLDPWWSPSFGYHWGNRGAVSSAPMEKPHRTSWRPLLECEFDLAYTPLMEMDYGKGRVTLCTLDLEDHAANDPAARRVAVQLLKHVVDGPLTPKAEKVIYLGDPTGAALLDDLGVNREEATAYPADAQLAIVGPGAKEDGAKAFAEKGGRILVLPRRDAFLGVQIAKKSDCCGSLNVPDWSEAAGLSASDTRWKSIGEAHLLSSGDGVEIAADGFLARKKVGRGAILFCQFNPRALPADEKTYFRYTRWRQMRALAQVLSNMGASFRQDARQMQLFQQPEHPFYLEGEWEGKLTKGLPEIHPRKGNAGFGITDVAKALVKPDAPETAFEKGYLPAYMESWGPEWKGKDGEAVFRKAIELPPYFAGRDLIFSCGRVDESEETYFNGEKVGESAHWHDPRQHVIPGRLVKAGRNVLALRTFDAMIHGGVCPQPYQFYLILKSEPTRFYHDDYRECYQPKDFPSGDDPYRYFRW